MADGQGQDVADNNPAQPAQLRAQKSRALGKIASLATSSKKVPRLFSAALIFGKKRVTAARPLLMWVTILLHKKNYKFCICRGTSTSDRTAALDVYQIEAQDNRVAWQKKGTLQNSAGLFSQFTDTQNIDVTNEVEVGEDGISVLDSTLPSPLHHSTPLVRSNKRRSKYQNLPLSTSKRYIYSISMFKDWTWNVIKFFKQELNCDYYAEKSTFL